MWFGGWWGSRLLWMAVAAAVVIPSSLYMGSPGEAEDVRQLRLGIAVESGNPSLVSARETEIGRSFDVVRVFKLWDDPFPTADDLELLDGRDLILSIKPARGAQSISSGTTLPPPSRAIPCMPTW